MKVKRCEGNPILAPTSNWWENLGVFNPGAAEYGGKVHLLYRAMGEDRVSRLGRATSEDGLRFDHSGNLPAYECDGSDPYERFGCEDPRITKIGDTYYVTYVAASMYPADHPRPAFTPGAPWRCRVGLLSTTDFHSYTKHGIILPDQDNKDVVLFPEKIGGRYAMLHRDFPHIWIAFSDDLLHWTDHKLVMSPRPGHWDCDRIGAGTPPLKTERGWLEIYHGVDSERRYHNGIVLLDLEDPSKVLARSSRPFLSPQEDYERIGLTPNVVFACGIIERDGEYVIYYGAADRTVAACILDKDSIFASRDLQWLVACD